MKKSELAQRILVAVNDMETAHVSDFNKKVLEELSETEFTGEIDDNAVDTAKTMLHSYLARVWADEPSAHKYVIGSCLALTFLFERPMHPEDAVRYIVTVEEGKERFFCPCNEKNSLCDICVAVPLE